MANTFGTDILIQAADPMEAANFYVKELGFEVTDKKSNMVSLHGKNINFFIERGCSWTGFRGYGQKRKGSQSASPEKGLPNR